MPVAATTLALCAASVPTRPPLVLNAAPTDTVHYFGVGSNMLRSKIVGRGLNGSKIELLDFEPAVVSGHRLAFNMRGFAPLEPAMGSLEPSEGPADAACHGALCTMTRAEYEKVWLSEGGGAPKPGYEEIVVEARAYRSGRRVQAVALRAREHTRLSRDACPSARYMGMLLAGASELGLEPSYLSQLEGITTQRVGPALRALAVNHLFFVSMLFRLKASWLVRAISKAVWAAYVPSSCASAARRAIGGACTGAMLLPSAALGAVIRAAMWAAGAKVPPMLAAVIASPPTPKRGEGGS